VTSKFKVIIPARFGSSRLPGKPLLMIGEKTLIQHVYDSACNSDAEKVVVATDDDRIEDVARSFGATVIMTSAQHQSGTDRIYEAATIMDSPDDEIIVNVQGDEYGLDPELINKVAAGLNDHAASDMATLCEKIIDQATYTDPNTVKVVMDINRRALYFSRAPIPWLAGHQHHIVTGVFGYKHIGIYAYRTGFLKQFSRLPKADIEQSEALEQLRALYNGYSIYVTEVSGKAGVEINTEEDLKLARKSLMGERGHN